jgi:multiple antibiotic resistance protein
METLRNIFLIVSALFPIVDPLGGSPIFLSLTRDFRPASRRTLSRQIAVNSFFLLLGSYLIGTHILKFFGISLPAVQVGGGLIVISTGWTLLKRKDDDERDKVHATSHQQENFHQAFYPLTLPLTVGPGSISVAVTLGANASRSSHSPFNVLAILAAIVGSAVIALSIFLSYGFADRLARMLGVTGMTVILRLTSFLLVCIGVQIVWNGVSAFLGSLPGH